MAFTGQKLGEHDPPLTAAGSNGDGAEELLQLSAFIRGGNDVILRERATTNPPNGKLDERLYAMQDAHGDVVALCDKAGAVQERYRYGSFGAFEVYDANYAPRGASSFDWSFLRRTSHYDRTTGFYFVGTGVLHPLLGRTLQRGTSLPVDEALLAHWHRKLLATADPVSVNRLSVAAQPFGTAERTLGDRLASLGITGGVVAINVAAWSLGGPFAGIPVTLATLAIGGYMSYQARQQQSLAMTGEGLDPIEATVFVSADLTGISAFSTVVFGQDIMTGQAIPTADRLETAAHLAVGLVVARGTPPIIRAGGRAMGLGRVRFAESVAPGKIGSDLSPSYFGNRSPFAKASEGIPGKTSIAELMETGHRPGTPGVTLTDSTVRFGDLYTLGERAGGIEFGLTREVVGGQRVFRLYSGGRGWVTYGTLSDEVRIIGHTHHVPGSMWPSEQDMMNADAALEAILSRNPNAPNPPRRVIYGPRNTDSTKYYGH